MTRTIRSLFVVLVSCAVLTGTARGQPVPAADSGSIVRVRTTRSVVEGVEPRNTNRGAGLLIRRLGARQRADLLTSIDDTSGSAWLDLSDAPARMVVHDVPSRLTVSMAFADLRRVFTTVLNARLDSVSVEAEVLGDGPVLLGHATRRVVYRQRFRLQAHRGNVMQVTRVAAETEALVAPGVPASWGSGSALSLTAGNASALIEQIFGAGSLTVRGGADAPTGLALRTVTRTTTQTEGNGAILGPASSSVTIDSAEVVSIERRVLPASLFAEPEGFRREDFGDELQRLVASLDVLSASLQQAAKAGKRLQGRKVPKGSKPAKGDTR